MINYPIANNKTICIQNMFVLFHLFKNSKLTGAPQIRIPEGVFEQGESL